MSYTWFVEPLDDFTNEYIANELSPENALREQWCDDENKHNLWRCEFSYINKLKNSQLKLRFHVFVQEGNGKKRNWIPPRKKAGAIKRGSDLIKK